MSTPPRSSSHWLAALAGAIGSIRSLFERPELQVVHETDQVLALRIGRRSVVIDARRRAVLVDERQAARFIDVKFVHVRESSSEDGPSEWSIVLHVGWVGNVYLGSTTDDVQASIVAARAASLMGKQVSAWR